MSLNDKLNKLDAALLKNKKLKKAFDDSWYVHSRMFGEILEPAFKDDVSARLRLVSALNLISRGKFKRGLTKLNLLNRECRTKDDFAAWNFFMGAVCDKAGATERASLYYAQSAKSEPKFYMVYLMLAKNLQREKRFDTALSAYLKTIECLEDAPHDRIPAIDPKTLLGSVHGNLATCLTMMRLYDEAEYELVEAQELGFNPPLLQLTWAMLYAATDRARDARRCMAALSKSLPQTASKTALSVEQTIAGLNPRYAVQKLDTKKLGEFWDWFVRREEDIASAVRHNLTFLVYRDLDRRLKEIFDFNDEKLLFALERDGEKVSLSFFDAYCLTYEIWLEKLIDLAPKSLRKSWNFYRAH